MCKVAPQSKMIEVCWMKDDAVRFNNNLYLVFPGMEKIWLSLRLLKSWLV